MSAALAPESLGDSTPESGSALADESLGDSGVLERSSESCAAAFLRRESLSDSGASGVPDALGEPDGAASGDALGEVDALAPPDGFEVGLEDGDGLEVPDEEPDVDVVGADVGLGLDDDEGDDVGEDVGEEVGDGLGEAEDVTGAATPGGTLAPAARSCCHDQPTDPPAGTVSEPTP